MDSSAGSSSTKSGPTTQFSNAFSSWNRGPLTTYFTPPASCLNQTTLTINDGTTTLYQGHYGDGDANCYPWQTRPQPLDWGPYYYSPGVCPVGWTSACTQTVSQAGMPTTLASATHAILCCPRNGYQCSLNNGGGHQCVAVVTAGQVLTRVWNMNSTGTLKFNANHDLTNAKALGPFTAPGLTSVVADGIPVWWQDADVSTFPTTTAPTIPVETSPTSTPTPSDTSNSGLSTGAKVAIGVVIPLVVIAALLGIFFFIRRRKQKQVCAELSTNHMAFSEPNAYNLAGDPHKFERQGYYGDRPAEADPSAAVISEMAANTAGRDGPQELPATAAAANNGTKRDVSPFRNRSPLGATTGSSEQGTPLMSEHQQNQEHSGSSAEALMGGGGGRSRETVEQKEEKLERLRKDIEKVRMEKERMTTLQELETMEARLKEEIMAEQRKTMGF